jgi:hypothetical protein
VRGLTPSALTSAIIIISKWSPARRITGAAHPKVVGMSITQYRAYHVGKDDHFKSTFDLECVDDKEAINIAKHLADGDEEVELWQGSRKVARLQAYGKAANGKRHGPRSGDIWASQFSGRFLRGVHLLDVCKPNCIVAGKTDRSGPLNAFIQPHHKANSIR